MLYKDILISGAGQLGSRYLQGLSKCANPLKIYVHDLFSESLIQAEKRWKESGGLESLHKVQYTQDLQEIPPLMDLTIVSSTATRRPEQIAEILKYTKVKYWILEKVLAQSIEGLVKIQDLVGRDVNAWLNTPRRIIPWYKSIKNVLQGSTLQMELKGGPWGIACNAIHFLDLVEWFTGEHLLNIDTSQLDKEWHLAKRAECYEIHGTLTASFSQGSVLILATVEQGMKTIDYKVFKNGVSWSINEDTGLAISNLGEEISGKLPFQSEMTTGLVDEILNTGKCDLTPLDYSINTHEVFLTSMLEHWRRNMDPSAQVLPIT